MAPNSVELPLFSTLEGTRLALFCGAGISRNSGAPIVSEFIDVLLDGLGLSQAARNRIAAAHIPFERLMEVLGSGLPLYHLLRVFDVTVPSTCHVVAARLARRGVLTAIATTNFDRLFEVALGAEQVIYRLLYKEEHFQEFAFDRTAISPLPLLKLHGTVDHPDSVRATLTSVASRRLSIQRENAIRWLFADGSHDVLLIVGYSCSDLFDISPVIEAIGGSGKETILIEHDERGQPRIEDITRKRDNNPFRYYSRGKRIYSNSDVILERLGASTGPQLPRGPSAAKLWKSHVMDWLHSTNSQSGGAARHVIAAALYQLAGDYRSAVSEAKCSVGLAGAYGSTGLHLASLFIWSQASFASGNYKEAESIMMRAVNLTNSQEDRACIVSYLLSAGSALIELGKPFRAIDYCRLAHNLASEVDGGHAQQMLALSYLGAAYRIAGQFDDAVRSLEGAEVMAVDQGYKEVEASTLGNLANVFYCQGNYEKADACNAKALWLAKAVGDMRTCGAILGGIGNVHAAREKDDEAIIAYREALEIAQSIHDMVHVTAWCGNMGRCYERLGSHTEARRYLIIALRVARKIQNTVNIANWCGNLGMVYRSLGRFEKAIAYGGKAVALFSKALGDEHRDTVWAGRELLKSENAKCSDRLEKCRDATLEQMMKEWRDCIGSPTGAERLAFGEAVGEALIHAQSVPRKDDTRKPLSSLSEQEVRELYRNHIGNCDGLPLEVMICCLSALGASARKIAYMKSAHNTANPDCNTFVP